MRLIRAGGLAQKPCCDGPIPSDLGNASPVEFIPVAEETGTIISIGEWVLRTAIEQNQDSGTKRLNNLGIVNLSAIQFRHTDLLMTVSANRGKLKAGVLELELTERVWP